MEKNDGTFVVWLDNWFDTAAHYTASKVSHLQHILILFLTRTLWNFERLSNKIEREDKEEPEEEQEFEQFFELEFLRMDLLCSLPPLEEMPETHLRSPLSAVAAGILSPEAVERSFSSYPSSLSFSLSLVSHSLSLSLWIKGFLKLFSKKNV